MFPALMMQRALGCVAATAALAAAAYHAEPAWAHKMGLDFWNLPGLYATWQSDLDYMAELNEQDRRVMVQIEMKQVIADQVALGSCSLAEAVQRFRNIHAGEPNYYRRLMLVTRPNTATVDEALAQQVMRLVQQNLEHDPSQLEERMQQLEVELAELLAATDRG